VPRHGYDVDVVPGERRVEHPPGTEIHADVMKAAADEDQVAG
jgi:hypothetical protein